MKQRSAFTMIELIFVIVIMGIIGKFGTEFLAQAYKSFLYTNVNHQLQSKSESAVEIIAKLLEYRIKDSVIARTAKGATPPIPIGNASGDSYTVLEWIGVDNEGFRGMSQPYWSGIIDLNSSNATSLVSPDTNTTQENNLVQVLSGHDSNITDVALHFIGSNSDTVKDYGWDGNLTYINSQKAAIHPVKNSSTDITIFENADGTSDFTGVDVYEYYQLAWTAYAIVLEDYNDSVHTGTLKIYYNYQPWKDKDSSGSTDQLNDAQNVKSAVIMDHVSTFKFMSIGSIMKIQVCVKSDILTNDGGDYSLCKEKTIF